MKSGRKSKWYDSEGQRSSRRIVLQQSNPTRTLVSLVLLLGLVLLLLQQLSDTQKVTEIGQAIGLFERTDSNDLRRDNGGEILTADRSVPTSESRRIFELAQLRADSDPSAKEQSIWEYCLSRLASEQQDLLFRFFLAPKSKVSTNEILPIVEECELAIKSWLARWKGNEETQSATEDSDLDQRTLEAMCAGLANWKADGTDPLIVGQPFRMALDRILLKRFLDNQNWMSKEQVVALRSWARIRELRNAVDQDLIKIDEFPIVELGQIMGVENSNHRGVPVRFLGTIAGTDERTGRLQADEWNGIAYRVWWMKPKDASSQPVAVYIPIELEPSQFESDEKSELEILGFFVKKKAYASQRGPEIAPVIFAAAVRKYPGSMSKSQGNFTQWLSTHSKRLTWEPPIDLTTPLKLIQASIELLPKPAETDSKHEGWDSKKLSLLLMAQKHDPELQTLRVADKTWNVANGLKIETLRGWCNQIKIWELDTISTPKNTDVISALRREGLEIVYELNIEAKETGSNSQETVFVTSIPNAWRTNQSEKVIKLWQPVEVIGFKLEAIRDDGACFVANRVSWKTSPQSTGTLPIEFSELAPNVNDVEAYLLQQGWDLAQKDLLQQLQSPAQPLSRQEEEAFFPLLRIANEQFASSTNGPAFTSTSMVQIIKNSLSASSQSKVRPALIWTECEARVVRVTRIAINELTQQRMLGQDHYYQLDCFADIGNVTFEIPTESESITYAGEYPITCVANRLPEWLLAYQHSSSPATDRNGAGMESKDETESTGDVFYPRITGKVSGWFYRFWSYRTQEMTQRLGVKHRQVTPLVVMARFETIQKPDQTVTRGTLSTVAWIIGLATTLAVWFSVRSYARSKAETKSNRIQFSLRKKEGPN